MDGVNIGDFRRADDCGNVEIALRGRGFADAHALVGKTDMQGFAVRFAMHSHRLDAHFFARPDDAASDFAAIGNQYFTKTSDVHSFGFKAQGSKFKVIQPGGPQTLNFEP
jgi:hypothetical protein